MPYLGGGNEAVFPFSGILSLSHKEHGYPMPDTPDLDRFAQTYTLADKLISDISKEDLAEVARILAMNLAQYQKRFGELPASDYLALMKAEEITPELAETLADGMEILIGVLGTMREQEVDVEVH